MNRNEYMKYYMRTWRKDNPVSKVIIDRSNRNRRVKAMQKINPSLKCQRCGRIDLLEIAHKNNDGKIDREKYPGAKFYDVINSGKRKTSDLELLCRICNLEDEIKRLKQKYPIIS